ncbi:unnamed protein product, partial [Owenia fusiformis]
SMLNESVLLSLTEIRRAPLKTLKIMVVHSEYYCVEIPNISSGVWKKLAAFSPELKVEVSIATRVPYLKLAGLLKPEIPLVALSYFRFAHYDGQDLASITEKYPSTLKAFTSLCQGDKIDTELVAMVTMCPNLQYFCYHGKLNYRTAIAIASLKGENWKHFELVKTQIGLSEQNQHKHNEIISIEYLVRGVSTALKRTWRPIETLPDVDEGSTCFPWGEFSKYLHWKKIQ